MISFLSGSHGGMESDGAITLVVGGVGYRVLVNDRDREELNLRGRGGEAVLFCRTTASENEIVVYGFLDEMERRAFDRLLKVNLVGPATALRLLSVLDVAKLTAAVSSRDAAALTAVPGIGRKTAEKIVAEVKL